MTKYCPKCNRKKPVVLFWKCTARSDGLRAYCIECSKKYAYPTSLEINKRRYINDEEFRERRKQCNRKQLGEEYQHLLEYQKQYRIKRLIYEY